jgi:hypothetical protein
MERSDDISPEDAGQTPTLPGWTRDIWLRSFGRNAAGIIKCRDYANAALSEIANPEEDEPFRRAWQGRESRRQ